MIFTSVNNHIYNYSFDEKKKCWNQTFKEDVVITNLKKLLVNYSPDILIFWMDCDEEGENIAFEIIYFIRSLKIRELKFFRAFFSSLTEKDVINAMNSLAPLNKHLSDAFEIRYKIDHIFNTYFTRFQTDFLALDDILEKNGEEIPIINNKFFIPFELRGFFALNLIVERAMERKNFISKRFYRLELRLKKNEKDKVTFNWENPPIYEEKKCKEICENLKNKSCKIISVEKKEKKKDRPYPLNTIEMIKLISCKLRMKSKEGMDIAKKLYYYGLISNPITESQKYKDEELVGPKILVKYFQDFKIYGNYCKRILINQRYNEPKKGSGDNKFHSPIHPVITNDLIDKYNKLTEKEKNVYDLIMRHFLATLSPDAKGEETTIEVQIEEERFKRKELIIKDKGYLEIYTFDYWANSEVSNFKKGEIVIPDSLKFQEETILPPNFLTEAELLGLIYENIGKDYTFPKIIKTFKEVYANADLNGILFKPNLLAACLIYGYDKIGIKFFNKDFIANMEREINEVAEGNKKKDDTYNKMEKDTFEIYNKVFRNSGKLKNYVKEFIKENPNFNQLISRPKNQIPHEDNNNCFVGFGNLNDNIAENVNKGILLIIKILKII